MSLWQNCQFLLVIILILMEGEKGREVDPRRGKKISSWSWERVKKNLTHQWLVAPKRSDKKNLTLQNLIPLIRKNLNVI